MAQIINADFSKPKFQELYQVSNHQIFTYEIPYKTEILLTFIHECDPQLKEIELSHMGLESLIGSYEETPGSEIQTINKIISSSPFYFKQKELEDNGYPQNIKISFNKFQNHLLKNTNFTLNELTGGFYAHFFEIFFDRYNNENNFKHDMKLFTKEEIRYGAIKYSNRTVQKTILEFPKINIENLDYFLESWEQIMFKKEIFL